MADHVGRMMSRRELLGGAALSAAGVMAIGLGNPGAKANESDSVMVRPSDNAQTSAEPLRESDIEVVDCDVLIIGAGLNGTYAANQILEEGGTVTFVEKGTWLHGGVVGMSVDLFNSTGTRVHKPADQFLLDVPYADSAHAMFGFEDESIWTYMVNHGLVIPTRNEDGSIEGFAGTDTVSQGYFFRKEQDRLAGKDGVTVFDRTMITNLLVSDGICCGAIGIHIPSGTLRVFRAKATIADTGGCTWMYGWFTVAAHTANGLENTADVDMAAWRLGCGIGESEFAGYDMIGTYPRGLAMAGGANIDAEPDDASAVCDKDGNQVFTETMERANNRVEFNQRIARLVYEEGRGTENGGVLFKVGEVEFTRYMYRRNLPVLQKFGIDTSTFVTEALPDMYDHGGQPVVDANGMTEIPGLFHGRGAGGTGIDGGALVAGNMVYGRYAGHKALEYARNAELPANINLQSAVEEYDRLQAIRTFQCGNPVTPHEVRVAIQQAGEHALGIYRTADMMNESLAQIADIRQNLLPRMTLRDRSTCCNFEWKQAIENYNLLDCCEMSIRASLLREESRGYYLRGDFPDIDNENWQCMLVCRYDDSAEDGMAFEKRDLGLAALAATSSDAL